MEDSQGSNYDAMDVDKPNGADLAPSGANGVAGPSSLLPRPEYIPRDHQPRASSEPTNPVRYTVGYVYSTDMLMHFHPQPDGHPEQPARIQRIWKLLDEAHLTARMKRLPIRKVRREEAMLVHSEDHWDKVIQLQYLDDQQRADSVEFYEQMSLYVMSGTTHAALLSCGGVIEASLAVARGEMKKSFAIVRPPGHHAEPDEHMGFCFFNNVAVAARVVQQMTPLKRILILDWDVHHGNGTQRAFDDDPSVLYISIHRYEQGTFYPCGPFGGLESSGVGEGAGYSVNIPWPRGEMGDADYLHAFQKIVMPIAMEFSPELVIISAGFDAADGDDLGECYVSPAGYAHMTHMLLGLAGGKVVVALEGGYNLDAISESALAVTRILLGEAPDALPPMVASDEATETVWLVAKHQSKFWKNVQPRACEPREEVEEVGFTIPEILKAHRQYYLYTNYDMMEIPLVTTDLDQRFSSQIMSTSDMLDNDTLVLFVHEFGNLRVELESSASCDIHLQKSYLLDISKQLIGWIMTSKYSLIDVNLFPKPVEVERYLRNPKSSEEYARDVLVYLWDNYIQLSNAKKVIIIGHGPGCRPVADLLSRRATGIMKVVKTVIQIVGLQHSAHSPSGLDELKMWYRSHSALILPAEHPMHSIKERARELRKHGSIAKIEETNSIQLIIKALPLIQQWVQASLERPDGTIPLDR